MSSPISSTLSSSPTTRPRRASKFTEGSYLTRPDILSLSPSSNDPLLSILSEMDRYDEKKRKHRNSNSSHSSFESFNSHRVGSPDKEREFVPKEGRRSITFGRSVDSNRRSLDDRPRDSFLLRTEEMAGIASKVKGRLRALTGGRREDVKPYPGT